VASPHVIEEASRNLKVKAPDRLVELDELLALVERVREAPPKIVAWSRSKELPDNDAPVLAAAAASGADILVTGDRTHFGHLFNRTVGGVTVRSLRRTLSALLEIDEA